jgi:hypothetical protein
MSLGFSDGSLKLCYTRPVGQEGWIDWNLSDFVNTIRDAMSSQAITPELSSLLIGACSQLLPGFAMNTGRVHWFIHPCISGTKVGFEVIASGDSDITKEFLASLSAVTSLTSKVPLSHFAVRSVSSQLGDSAEIVAQLFVLMNSAANAHAEFSLKLLFDSRKLTKTTIEQVTALTCGGRADGIPVGTSRTDGRNRLLEDEEMKGNAQNSVGGSSKGDGGNGDSSHERKHDETQEKADQVKSSERWASLRQMQFGTANKLQWQKIGVRNYWKTCVASCAALACLLQVANPALVKTVPL